MRSLAAVNALRDEVEAIVARTTIPSVSLNVIVSGWEAFHHTAGLARTDPPRPAREDQPYDLASLTKALAGSTVTASLIEEGRLSLDLSVHEILPEVDPRVTLAHLLTHSGGLPKWNAFYAEPDTAWGLEETRRRILRAARHTDLEREPGSAHVYTDVGFLLLLAVIEEVTGQHFDQAFHERVLVPAGEHELRWGWPGAAATEKCAYRGFVVEGTVHDLNCAALGGISTHAGLFAPARAVSRLAWQLLRAVKDPDSSALPGRTLGQLWTLRGAGSHVGGWDTPTRGGYTSTGRCFPDDSVGHLGYTGTSLWIVPSRDTVVTLLTNRVHPTDTLDAIRAARPRIHDAMAEALGWEPV